MWAIDIFAFVCFLHLTSAAINLCANNNSDYYYPSTTDCNKYYACKNGVLTSLECEPKEYHYNCLTKKCENMTHCCASAVTSTLTPTTLGVTEPTPTTTTKACSKKTDRVPFAGDCTKYFECDGEQLVEKQCPLRMKYNCLTKSCTFFTIFTPCCLNNTASDNSFYCLNNGVKIPNVFTCNKYFQCISHRLKEQVCDTGYRYDWFSGNCVEATDGNCAVAGSGSTVTPVPTVTSPPINNNTLCPQDGVTYPNTKKCQGYFLCQNGNLVEQLCPEGLVFNCFTRSCQPNFFAPCCKDDPAPQKNQSSLFCFLPGISVPNPFTCDKYFKCENSVIVEKQCAEGERYDWIFMKCVTADSGSCYKGTTSGVTQTPSPLCSQDGLTYPNVANCRKYFTCKSGQLVEETCFLGTSYNCLTKSCRFNFFSPCCNQDPKPPINGNSSNCFNLGLKVPNPFNCKKYYTCNGFNVTDNECPSEEVFDWLAMKCKKSGHCGIVSLPPQTSSTESHPITITTPITIVTTETTSKNPSSDITTGTSISTLGSTNTIITSTKSSPTDTEPTSTMTTSNNTSTESITTPTESTTTSNNSSTTTSEPTGTSNNTSTITFTESSTTTSEPTGTSSNPSTITVTESPTTTSKPMGTSDNSSTIIPTESPTTTSKPMGTSDNSSTIIPTESPTTTSKPTDTSDNSSTIIPTKSSTTTSEPTGTSSNPSTITLTESSTTTSEPTGTSDNSSIIIPTKSPTTTSEPTGTSSNPSTIIPTESPTTTSEPTGTSSNSSTIIPTESPTTTSEPTGTSSNPSTITLTKSPTTTSESTGTSSNSSTIIPTESSTTTFEPTGTSSNPSTITLTESTTTTSDSTSTSNNPSITTPTETTISSSTTETTTVGSNTTSTEPATSSITSEKATNDTTTTITVFTSKSTATEIITTTEISNTTSRDTNEPLCPQDGVTYPNSANCHNYFECRNKTLIEHSCPFGLVWNCFTKSCQLKFFSPCCKNDPNPPPNRNSSTCLINGIKIPNIFTCNKYYECKNLEIVEEQCPSGERYSWILMKCVTANSGPCHVNEPTNGITTTTLKPSPLCSQEGSTYPNPNNCHSYYTCVNGQLEMSRCSFDLVFNCLSGMCEPSNYFAPCCKGDPNPPTSGNMTDCTLIDLKIPNPFSCNDYFECNGFNIIEKTCPKGERFDWLSMTCVTESLGYCGINSSLPTVEPPSLHKCSKGSKYADVFDKNSYYKCDNGTLTKHKCPFNWSFNCWFHICTPDLSSDTYCYRGNIPSGQKINCPMLNAKIPDPYNCSNYYTCSFFVTKQETCGSNDYFDIYTQTCLPIDESTCISDISNSTTTSTAITSDTPTTPSTSLFCKFFKKLPDGNNCQNYYECNGDGQLIHKTCPSNSVYNCITSKCGSTTFSPCCFMDPLSSNYTNSKFCLINNLKYMDFFNCSNYYECKNNEMIYETCPDGKKYNLFKLNCDKNSNGYCLSLPHINITIGTTPTNPTTVTPTTRYPLCMRDGIRYPSTLPNDCGGYYECINGILTKQSCKVGEVYNCVKEICEFQATPHCCAGAGLTTTTLKPT